MCYSKERLRKGFQPIYGESILMSTSDSKMADENNSDIPPFSEYILASDRRESISLLREEQVISLLGEDAAEYVGTLKPSMILSMPDPSGPIETPLYDWREVRALAAELGIDIHCVPATLSD